MDGPWGDDMPLRDLADGYKSAFIWIADFMGWALGRTPALGKTEEIKGIVLIDEIEQHLHPSWQDRIIDQLQRMFPKVQFLATTHAPIIAASIGDRGTGANGNRLLYLKTAASGAVTGEVTPAMAGWRIDQVLASGAFDYFVASSRALKEELREASRLASRTNLKPHEKKRYHNLKQRIADAMIGVGQTPIEREIESERLADLRNKVITLEEELFPNDSDS